MSLTAIPISNLMKYRFIKTVLTEGLTPNNLSKCNLIRTMIFMMAIKMILKSRDLDGTIKPMVVMEIIFLLEV